MTTQTHVPDLFSLLNDLCNGVIDDRGAAALESILADDPAARELYLACMHLHVNAMYFADVHGESLEEAVDAGLLQNAGDIFDVADVDANDKPLNAQTFFLPAEEQLIPGLTPDAPCGSTGYFFSGWPVAYLISAVLIGLSLLAASLFYVSDPIQLVRQSGVAQTRSDNMPVVIGRVTAAVDCKWADPETETVSGAYVSLGRKYVLASGLLEITYKTGAKVILQGPCAYEAESPDGGFLSLGKLTARVEKREKRRGERGEKAASETNLPSPIGRGAGGEGGMNQRPASSAIVSNHKSEIPLPSPLFTVFTPSAVVTDLGTEFGVEVDERGDVVSYVFQGKIKLQTLGDGVAMASDSRILQANESAKVEKRKKGRPVISNTVVASDRFVTTIPKPQIQPALQVVAHFRLGEDDRSAFADLPAASSTANHDRADPLKRLGSPLYNANKTVPGSKLAMSFNSVSGDCFHNRNPYSISDSFILEAWVCPAKPIFGSTIVAYVGYPNRSGCGLMTMDGTWRFAYGGIVYPDSGVPCKPGVWTHLALVCQRGKSTLWINGRPTKAQYPYAPTVPEPAFTIGGNGTRTPKQSFDGQIDEVRLSVFSGPFQPEMLLFPTVTVQK